MSEAVIVRNFAPGDLAYVFSHVLRDMRDADPSPLPDRLWYPPHRAWLEEVLADPNTVVLIAAASDKPDEILGFVIAQPKEVLHWIEIRKGLRGRGLAKLLLSKADVPPGTPAAWATTLGKIRLRNPPRGRTVRALLSPRGPQPSTGSPSRS